MHIPFGAKVLFWNNPKRVDNTAGELSPTSNEVLFLVGITSNQVMIGRVST
jgi:hypothetical protein